MLLSGKPDSNISLYGGIHTTASSKTIQTFELMSSVSNEVFKMLEMNLLNQKTFSIGFYSK